MTTRAGLLRHWGQLETRTSSETGTKDASISYATITKIRCHVTPLSGAEFVSGRGGDQSRQPTVNIEFRRVPDLSKANYILMLNGPYSGLRYKMDERSLSRLGRRIFIAAYQIGEPGEFSAPTTPTLPDII